MTMSRNVFHGPAPSTRAASPADGEAREERVEEINRERARHERQELDVVVVAVSVTSRTAHSNRLERNDDEYDHHEQHCVTTAPTQSGQRIRRERVHHKPTNDDDARHKSDVR